MKRGIVLGVLFGAGGLSLALTTAQPPRGGGQQEAPAITAVEQLEDNLFVLRGGGGNTVVFIASNGVVVVDTKNPGWGQPILDEIKALTSKPVTTLINTHSHADHASGNVEFPATVDIVTHENTKANMEVMRAYTGRDQPPVDVFKQNNGKGCRRGPSPTGCRLAAATIRSTCIISARPYGRRRLGGIPIAADTSCR